MQIRDKGKYLGMFIGPGVSPDTNWDVPIGKFMERAAHLAAQGWPIEMIPNQFSSKAVSVLGYVAQLQPPPVQV